MVTKTTFKKKFPDVKMLKLQTSVVFSRQQVEETVLKMCDSLGTGLLYYSYSNKWITVYTSGKLKKALELQKGTGKKIGEVLVDLGADAL